jgi:hypothetical protein
MDLLFIVVVRKILISFEYDKYDLIVYAICGSNKLNVQKCNYNYCECE